MLKQDYKSEEELRRHLQELGEAKVQAMLDTEELPEHADSWERAIQRWLIEKRLDRERKALERMAENTKW